MKYLFLQLPRVLASHNSHLRVSWPKIASFFLRLHSLFGTELIQWKVDKWVQRSNMLALKRQISKVIWTPKLTTGSVEAFASILQKQEKQTNKPFFSVQPYFFCSFLYIFPRSPWMQISTSESISKITWSKGVHSRIDLRKQNLKQDFRNGSSTSLWIMGTLITSCR